MPTKKKKGSVKYFTINKAN